MFYSEGEVGGGMALRFPSQKFKKNLFRPKPRLCSMKFEHLPSVNLVWHDLKLQHCSSKIVGIEEPFILKKYDVIITTIGMSLNMSRIL